jgi:galactose-1-phosphate uridylyltransferase
LTFLKIYKNFKSDWTFLIQSKEPIMSTSLFSEKQTKDFTSLLQYILEYSQNGIDSKIYEALWKMTGEKDLATVYLTLMLGKLTLMGDNYVDFTSENSTQELTEKSFEEVFLKKYF